MNSLLSLLTGPQGAPPPGVPAPYLSASLLIFCVGAVISTLEFITVLPAFRSTGLYSWPVLRAEQVQRLGIGGLHGPAGVLGPPPVVAGLLLVRLLCLVSLPFLTLQTPAFTLAALTLAGTTLVFTWRRYIGDDGSDQMNTLLVAVIVLCAGLGRSGTALSIGLGFLAFQACLSYAAAGFAKAFSREWRDGSAMFKIFNTEAYGLPWVARGLHRRRWLGLLLCWGVILGECLFPVILVLPLPGVLAMLAMGVVFHGLCAAIMGLNSFLWAFMATYPAILYANLFVRAYLTGS